MNNYPYLIAAHIIFIITWFSALFYIVRLFIYHTEALGKTEPDKSILSAQFEIMERRLMNIIGTPSMILVLITGISLISLQPQFLQDAWLQLKLFFVLCVLFYHFICLNILKKLSRQTSKLSSQQLRLFNELATLFLVGIIFLVELKNMAEMWKVFLSLIVLGIVLMLAIKSYKRMRNAK